MNSQWRKSTYSGASGECVECRTSEEKILVRDTRNRNQGHLTFPVPEWRAFLADVDAL